MRAASLPFTRLFLCTAVAVLATAGHAEPAPAPQGPQPPDLLTPIYSRTLKVSIDVSAAPECQAWAERARAMVELWHPIVSAYLDAPLRPQSGEIRLVFKDMPGVAHSSGQGITIASGWVKSHPDDIGMVLHELVHVIQNYPPHKSVWLMEGIADYVRFWMAEPSGQPKGFNRAKDNYRQGYRTTGAFLAWIEQKYEVSIIRDANRALRKGNYADKLFEEKTGKNLDALWEEFMNSLTPKQG